LGKARSYGGRGGGFAKAKVCSRSCHESKIRKLVIDCQVVKEWAARPDLFPGRAPQFVGDVAGGMKREGQKVEGNENRGKVLLAVAEIVFEMVTLVLSTLNLQSSSLCSCRQAENPHFACVLTIGDEFRERTVFCGTQEKIRKHPAQGVGNDKL